MSKFHVIFFKFAGLAVVLSCGKNEVKEQELPSNGPRSFEDLKGLWIEESIVTDYGNERSEPRKLSLDEGRIHGFDLQKYNRFTISTKKFLCSKDQNASIDKGSVKVVALEQCPALESVVLKTGLRNYQWIEMRFVKDVRVLTRFNLVPLSETLAKRYAPLIKEDKNATSDIFSKLK